MSTLREFQEEIWANKVSKGFNTTDVNREFNFAYGELAEAFEAYHKKLPSLGEELADVAIYLMGLSQMVGVDLEREILRKISKNKDREYRNVDGANIRVKEGKE